MSSSEAVINVISREETGKGISRRLRADGMVPAVIYGHGKEATPLAVSQIEISPYLHHAGLVKLKVDGKGRGKTAVIKDYQLNMLRREIIHVDFMEVRADEVISATVEITAHGTPAGANQGGMLDQVVHAVELRGPANKLPESIVADVSGLEIGDTLTVSALEIPENFEIVGDQEQIVFSVHVARIDEPEEEAEEGGEEEVEESAETEAEETE
jgi:large subunit ribosomal protein L25